MKCKKCGVELSAGLIIFDGDDYVAVCPICGHPYHTSDTTAKEVEE